MPASLPLPPPRQSICGDARTDPKRLVPETAPGHSNLTDRAMSAFLPLPPPRQSISRDARIGIIQFQIPFSFSG